MKKITKIFFIFLSTFLMVSFIYNLSYVESWIEIKEDNVHYNCNGEDVTPQADYCDFNDEISFDMESVEDLDYRFFKDKDNVYYVSDSMRACCFHILTHADPNTFMVLNNYYQIDADRVYSSVFYRGFTGSEELKIADSSSFEVLGGRYAKDNNNVFHNQLMSTNIVEEADLATFEVMSEDDEYAMDKNHMYYIGGILDDQGIVITLTNLYNTLKGKIVLKVEENGEAYYISPAKKEMFFLSRPVIAFNLMRDQGIGITNENLEKIPVADNYCPSYQLNCDKPQKYNQSFANQQKGKIFLQVENNGEAWYVNPSDGKRYFLGRPTDAFNIMRNLGLGISNIDFDKL